MLLKYSLSTQITNNTEADVKWILPATITLATSNTYAFTSVDITKGIPFIISIDSTYIVRYLAISSD
jgi:hypothetical protein